MDNETGDILEEGEILDYEPLPRPSVTANDCFRSTTIKTCDSDSSDSSNSDCDAISHKKRKIIKKNEGRNKFNVWASEFQTSELMDEICGWETGLKDRVMDKSRDVESYYHFPEEIETKCSDRSSDRKRRYGDVVDLREKLGKRHNNDHSDSKIHPRYLSELKVTVDDSLEDVTQDITLKLCEEKEDLVLRVVSVLGKEKAIETFNKTKNIEEVGGMMVMNGSRRRTPGGVFIQLIKKNNEITKEQKNQIFIDVQKVGNQFKTKPKISKKRESDGKSSMEIDNNHEDLPDLPDRKNLAVALSSSKTNEVSCVADASCSAKEHVDPRELAIYDDIFDDNPCDIEFT